MGSNPAATRSCSNHIVSHTSRDCQSQSHTHPLVLFYSGEIPRIQFLRLPTSLSDRLPKRCPDTDHVHPSAHLYDEFPGTILHEERTTEIEYGGGGGVAPM